MGENRFSCSGTANGGRESFGIEASRILDACRDRDCFEDVRVFLTGVGEELIARTNNVRVKCAKLCGANIVTEPVQFNSGFYAVDVKFYIGVTFEVCVPLGTAQEFDGVAVLEKRVVLYGGESNVSVFKSDPDANDFCTVPEPACGKKNVPTAVVEVVDPIILNARVVELKSDCCCHCCCCADDLPQSVVSRINGVLTDGHDGERILVVSIGLFSVVRIVRPAQYLISATEYAVPDKECHPDENASPCCVFNSMPFPTHEFSPRDLGPKLREGGKGCCGS